VHFKRDVVVNHRGQDRVETIEDIKVSRGEENVFIWCFFLAIVQLVIDKQEGSAYDWVKYIYIDDPISSLDDNNAIAVAVDLVKLLKQIQGNVKVVISSHHSLFFNVLTNEFKRGLREGQFKKYFLTRPSSGVPTAERYVLQDTGDTPFFYHVSMLKELQDAVKTGRLYTYHFNMMRNIMEKTASFFGHKDFSFCIKGLEGEAVFSRALNLLSHGGFSLFEPKEMQQDNKQLFADILNQFLTRFEFVLSDMAQNLNVKSVE
jgi:wobble nucleotide-excising tRNase